MVWKAAFRMLITHPLFGVGWTHFYEVVTDYGADHRLIAHNTIISVFAETGLIGGITFLLILKHSFKQMYNVFKEGDEMIKIIAIGLIVSLIVFMVNTSFSVKDHDPTYWLIISFVAACAKIFLRLKAQQDAKVSK